MTEPLLDPDASREYLRDWKGRVDRAAAAAQVMSERLGQAKFTAADGNGLVEVTIDSSGVLLAVEFSERIQRVPPEAVSRAVMGALGIARGKAARVTREIIDETLGPDSTAGRLIKERQVTDE
ncbi:YbaB/EbfC family nucleoid-associated protein [Paractinoplanes lichenicola]|uniref:YbaB/EbfC family nucleoid-associated protein n=1 Tax=Paractinoplanes lichenicola TaxID=2802976 RepID=A0ABS1VNA3_9ACTN|nr:YbaB/EbfC family nucleoid-associated protein [Actinoplanes lichenicola]MBL7256209.1 YbaB/EbfC family nucleoid-associated protein [Actinoplanes lichenicola]